LNAVEQHTGVADATAEGQALRQVLSEIDDTSRATLGSITIATMRKLVDRHRADCSVPRPKPVGPRLRD